MRILLVENDSDEHFVNVRNDESKNHQQLSIGLTQRHPHSDISVVQVKDAYEACSKIDNNDFDLVLVDYFHEKK
ncbi:MAG: hypothetical protein GY928_26290, partial [Colwellia sp.]|nr:hypothetical protein [Colwellia sp.]